MTSADLLSYWPLIVAAVAAVIWLVRLEGRVAIQAALLAAHKEATSESHNGLKSTLDEIKASVDKVYDRLDRKVDK